jgi:cytochrome c biogenesis protein CcmG/thiol:disulfide interchange protein DsbE
MFIPVVIFAMFAMSALYSMKTKNDELPSTLINKPAPAITTTPLVGHSAVTPEMLTSGAVTVVNFWASWCPPCRAEHPNLLALQSQGIRIVGVNFKDNEADAARYLKNSLSPFIAVAFDPSARTAIDWGVTAPPETFILAPDGTVAFRYIGPLVGTDYERRFLPELKKALEIQ